MFSAVSLSQEDLLEVAQQVGTDSFRLGVLLGVTPEEMEQLVRLLHQSLLLCSWDDHFMREIAPLLPL